MPRLHYPLPVRASEGDSEAPDAQTAWPGGLHAAAACRDSYPGCSHSAGNRCQYRYRSRCYRSTAFPPPPNQPLG
jgi:hypothetical protein